MAKRQKVKILQREITYSIKTIKGFIKSLKHSMRMEMLNKNINFDYSKSVYNKVFINEKLKGGVLTDNDKLELIKELEQLLFFPIPENKIDPTFLATTTRDFKRFLEVDLKNITNPSKNEKERYTNEQRERRKELTEKVLNGLKNGLKGNVLTEEELKEYKELVKENRIEKINELNGKTQIKMTTETIQVVESFLKIPVDYNVDLTAEQSNEINKDFYKTYFPNWKIIASFEHNDEELIKIVKEKNGENYKTLKGGNHAHSFLSVKNTLTNKFDYTEQKYRVVKEQLLKEFQGLETKEDFKNWYIGNYFELEEKAPEEFLNLKTNEERINYIIGEEKKQGSFYNKQRLGVVYQNIIYNFCNEHKVFKDLNIQAVKFSIEEDISREDIFLSKEKISKNDKNLLNEKLFSGNGLAMQNIEMIEEMELKLKELVKSKENTNKNYNEQINQLTLTLTKTKNLLAEENNLLGETKETLKTTKETLNDTESTLENKLEKLTITEKELLTLTTKETELLSKTELLSTKETELLSKTELLSTTEKKLLSKNNTLEEKLKNKINSINILSDNEGITSDMKEFFKKYFIKEEKRMKNSVNSLINTVQGRTEQKKEYKIGLKGTIDFEDFIVDLKLYTDTQRSISVSKDSQKQITDLIAKIEEKEKSIIVLSGEKSQLNTNLTTANNKIKTLEGEKSQLNTNLTTANNKIKTLEPLNEKNKELTTQNEKYRRMYNELIEGNEDNIGYNELLDFERENAPKLENIPKLEEENTKLKTENSKLKNLVSYYKNESENLKENLKKVVESFNYYKNKFMSSIFKKEDLTPKEIIEQHKKDTQSNIRHHKQ